FSSRRRHTRSKRDWSSDVCSSDLIVAGERPKLRVDGDIVYSSAEAVLTPKDTLSIAYSVLTENQKKRFEIENELDFSFGIQNLEIGRASCRERGGVGAVGESEYVQ